MQAHIVVSNEPDLLELVSAAGFRRELLIGEVEAVDVLHRDEGFGVAHDERRDAETEPSLLRQHPDGARGQ